MEYGIYGIYDKRAKTGRAFVFAEVNDETAKRTFVAIADKDPYSSADLELVKFATIDFHDMRLTGALDDHHSVATFESIMQERSERGRE